MRSETEALKSDGNSEAAAPRSRAWDVAAREVRKFGTLFLYLVVVFGAFSLHQWVVLTGHHISYVFYGASVVNALILAKIMHVAEALHYGERFRDKPLVYPILYKSVAFGWLLVAVYVLEGMLVGALKGESLAASLPHIGNGTPASYLAITLIMCVALIPFFALQEIRRAYGPAAFDALMFREGEEAGRR